MAMTVGTSSTGDFAAGAGAEVRGIDAAVEAAEAVLAHRFGSAVTLVDPEDLAGSGPATVVRARVASASFALPKTIVIKHYPDPPGVEGDPFAQEAVSYQLFNALQPEERMCPELLAHDGHHRVLVIEDLGRLPTLEDKLCGNDARAAETALLSWARSLGRLHASTASREADFNALLRRLGGRPPAEETMPVVACAQLPALLEQTLGVPTPEALRHAGERAGEHARGSSYRAFSPVDLWPDNNLVTDSGVRFLDFERGRVRNALVDAAHLRVPFVSGPDALALPPGMSEAMVAAWRAEVSGIWPTLSDDDALSAHLLDSQLLLVWVATWSWLPKLDTGSGSVSTGRAAALVTWWLDLARQAERGGGDIAAEHAAEVAAAIDRSYGPGIELALYPAFR